MELKDKIITALREPLQAEYIRLDDDDGISGYVVSSRFERMSNLDRQKQIEEALQNAAEPLTRQEQRQVLMIAGLTPLEYESIGARIRVHRIRELGDGSLEVVLHGGYSDALYVRGALNNEKGVSTTDPEQSPGAPGILMTFLAKGSCTNPLTKQKAVRLLKADRYIEVMENAEPSDVVPS